jgi:hypothetical protein
MRKPVPASHGAKRVKPTRKFGILKGKIKIIDPRWAAPMTRARLDEFLEGR